MEMPLKKKKQGNFTQIWVIILESLMITSCLRSFKKQYSKYSVVEIMIIYLRDNKKSTV